MEDALWAQLQNTHLDDEDDKHRVDSETDEEVDSEEEIHEKSDFLPQDRNTGPQTGPKGVKADHDYHQRKQLEKKSKAISEYNARLLAKAPTTTTYLQDQAAKEQEELVIDYNQSIEQDELSVIREKRLRELRQLKDNNHLIRQREKVFGQLTTITMEEYIEEIDDEWKTVPVIVHIYDETLPKCKELDQHLSELARKYLLAKFIRISASEIDFDLVGSPAILVYHGGILVANLVRLVDEVKSRFDVDSIEDVLLKYKALSENDLYEIPNQSSDEED